MASAHAELWDDYAPKYPDLYKVLSVQAHFHDVVEALALNSDSRVLDVGCGPGFLLRAIQQVGLVHPLVVGIDSSADMLALARRIWYSVAIFQEVDLNTPSHDWKLGQRFNRIACINSLYALSDPPAVLSGLAEHAVARARLVISTPKEHPSVDAVREEHLRLFAAAGGDRTAEELRFNAEFAEVMGLNRERILPNPEFHYVSEQTLRNWFEGTAWELQTVSSTYADQNWLGVAIRR